MTWKQTWAWPCANAKVAATRPVPVNEQAPPLGKAKFSVTYHENTEDYHLQWTLIPGTVSNVSPSSKHTVQHLPRSPKCQTSMYSKWSCWTSFLKQELFERKWEREAEDFLGTDARHPFFQPQKFSAYAKHVTFCYCTTILSVRPAWCLFHVMQGNDVPILKKCSEKDMDVLHHGSSLQVNACW